MKEVSRKNIATTRRAAVPPKYASPSRTDIRYNVTTGGSNRFTIELSD